MHLETFTVQVRGHFETLNFYTGCFLAEGAMHVVTSPECGTENPSEPKTGTEKLFLAEAKLNRHLGTERKKI